MKGATMGKGVTRDVRVVRVQAGPPLEVAGRGTPECGALTITMSNDLGRPGGTPWLLGLGSLQQLTMH